VVGRAKPARWRLQWLYGDQLEWRLRMVGLTERPEDYIDKGFTPERQSSSFARLGDAYGMPMDTSLRPRIADGASLSAPGFQPTLAYEVAIANLAPELTRRDDPESVAEVVEWAGEALATAEVAAVCGIELGEAREELGRVAAEEHVGSDGLWALEPAIA
jgi:hypothetical protein